MDRSWLSDIDSSFILSKIKRRLKQISLPTQSGQIKGLNFKQARHLHVRSKMRCTRKVKPTNQNKDKILFFSDTFWIRRIRRVHTRESSRQKRTTPGQAWDLDLAPLFSWADVLAGIHKSSQVNRRLTGGCYGILRRCPHQLLALEPSAGPYWFKFSDSALYFCCSQHSEVTAIYLETEYCNNAYIYSRSAR